MTMVLVKMLFVSKLKGKSQRTWRLPTTAQILDDALRAFAHALKLPGPESLPPYVFYRRVHPIFLVLLLL